MTSHTKLIRSVEFLVILPPYFQTRGGKMVTPLMNTRSNPRSGINKGGKMTRNPTDYWH